jgi:enamine deaminase RidA (YjgF/YER057c/UK114 family)
MLFTAVRRTLENEGARLLQDRVFAAPGALPLLEAIRSEAYGHLDDGVRPAWLAVPEGRHGALAGVQVHAVRGPAPQVIRLAAMPCGRVLELGHRRWVALSGLATPGAGARTAQARAVLERAEACLRQAGADFRHVARTWMWLGDIVEWYREFNAVRNRFFRERGLLDSPTCNGCLPASTGIGIRPIGAACGLDLIAVRGSADDVVFHSRAGRQGPPCDYGSAFSRAARARTPAGETVFVSGTAAIGPGGTTMHAGDAEAQIAETLLNVRAVLDEMGCGDEDVVQATAYSKTPEVDRLFRDGWADLEWPCVAVAADVCRDDLLFEIEATALRGARQRSVSS